VGASLLAIAVYQLASMQLIRRYREQARSHRVCFSLWSVHTKKALPSRPALFYQSVEFLSLHDIPQRFQLRLAEQSSGVALHDQPTLIRFSDLTRSIGLQPLRQGLKRLTINGQGMACALAYHIHSSALSWLMSGKFIQGLLQINAAPLFGTAGMQTQELCQCIRYRQ